MGSRGAARKRVRERNEELARERLAAEEAAEQPKTKRRVPRKRKPPA